MKNADFYTFFFYCMHPCVVVSMYPCMVVSDKEKKLLSQRPSLGPHFRKNHIFFTSKHGQNSVFTLRECAQSIPGTELPLETTFLKNRKKFLVRSLNRNSTRKFRRRSKIALCHSFFKNIFEFF